MLFMMSKTPKSLRARLHKPELSDSALLKWEAANWALIERKLAEADIAIAEGDVRELSLEAFLREARRLRRKKSA